MILIVIFKIKVRSQYLSSTCTINAYPHLFFYNFKFNTGPKLGLYYWEPDAVTESKLSQQGHLKIFENKYKICTKIYNF